MATDGTLTLALSRHFRGKENIAPTLYPCRKHGVEDRCWAYAAFDNTTLTPTQLALHVTDGGALCVAALKRDPAHPKARRTELYNFASSQLIGIDFDHGPAVGDLLKHDVVRDHAFLVYATASSTPEAPRSRALFRLSEPVTDLSVYREYVARLLRLFALEQADELQDGVRIFYGSNQPGSELRPAKVLPLALLDSLPATPPPPPRRASAPIRASDDADRQMILDALGCIPDMAISYRDWITVLAALHDKFGADAVAIADGWTGANSENGEIEMRMKTFERGSSHPASAGTIVHLAKQYGYQPPTRPVIARPSAPPLPDIRPAVSAPTPTPAPLPAVTWHTSDDSMARYKERLRLAGNPKRLPLPFPFEVLKEAGGFCWAIPPGVLVGIVGASGGAKTSFVETLVERWRQLDAHHALWWGPEWSWERMADRSAQRLGGPRADEMMLHEIALSERAAHLPPERRFGRLLSAQAVEQAEKLADRVASWPGKNHYIDQMDLEIDDLLTEAEKRVHAQEAAGAPLRIAVFDYVQLLNMRSARSEAERLTQVLGRIKAFCVDQQLVGLVVSQVTKQTSAAMRDGTETLDAESGQFQRSDKFNLVLTLNPIYEDGQFAGRAILKVAKNSLGRTLQKVVPVDMSKLVWVDKELPAERNKA